MKNSTSLQINQEQLRCVLKAIDAVEAEAAATGVALTPSKASDIVAMRGVLEAGSVEDDPAPLSSQLLEEAGALIKAFNDMREAEGTALEQVLLSQLKEVAALTEEAKGHAKARSEEAGTILRRNLRRVLDNSENVDADRVAQELALIAVKSDVTEEIDRLAAHISAAQDLISEGGPVGRKLDFLMQEFNREANTLCAKAQNTELTRCGLALKAVIDQMREQVQNVE